MIFKVLSNPNHSMILFYDRARFREPVYPVFSAVTAVYVFCRITGISHLTAWSNNVLWYYCHVNQDI